MGDKKIEEMVKWKLGWRVYNYILMKRGRLEDEKNIKMTNSSLLSFKKMLCFQDKILYSIFF